MEDEYVVLLMGFFMIFCELLWINHILTGNVPPERMKEYVGAMLFGLGITVFSFWFFRWSRRKRKKESKKVIHLDSKP